MTTVTDTTSAPPTTTSAPPTQGRRPLNDLQEEPKGTGEKILVGIFVAIPMVALVAAIPLAWGWGLGWHDVIIAIAFYYFTGLGISLGFHRYFTHGSFKAKEPLRVVMAVAGTMAIEGPILTWVADHRRHHKFSDQDGDPHSPWRYGETFPALVKGLWFAHMGWLFDEEQTDQRQYAPDLLKDRAIVRVSRAFPWLVIASILAPARSICAASSHNSGPLPASTVRPLGTSPCALSAVCAAPAVITPGRVQPGIGNGRSSEPVATITRRAWIRRA